jgi:hypothetical protein
MNVARGQKLSKKEKESKKKKDVASSTQGRNKNI